MCLLPRPLSLEQLRERAAKVSFILITIKLFIILFLPISRRGDNHGVVDVAVGRYVIVIIVVIVVIFLIVVIIF